MPHPAALPLPAPALRPFVARYVDVAVDVPPGQWLVQRVSPPGGATLSLRWGGSVALLDTTPPTEPPAVAFTGPITRGGITGCAGALRMFVIFFSAAGAHDIFGVEMPRLANRSVDAGPLLGGWTRALADAVAAAPCAEGRRTAVEAALLERMAARPVQPGLGARAAEWIGARSGVGPVAEVPAALGVSERTLRRHFLREVGVPLKAYARWVRFSRAHEYLSGPEHRSWVDAAHVFGYADQAHLVREYRHFAGEPPSHLVAGERLYDPAFVADAGGRPRL
ncbi:MAG TPA: helix-turn-helix domain-containing protein [Longimicrobium sp.]|jgi:AraC-like DNA-binding protein|uniref:AraC family transcriptional regulator n=1 Tax=Longimicrobium sp. TaxID=2029185 RepID=UPI002EDA106F